MTSDPKVTRAEIEAARKRIRPHIRATPVLHLEDAFDAGFRLSLKLDHLQPTGSFKVRGAFSLLTASDIPTAGVAAASGGNFGLAVAYACTRLGHTAAIFVPETSPLEKIDRILAEGADVTVVPGYYDQALAECELWVEQNHAFRAHAYDLPEVVAGQGTAGLEIVDQVPDVDAVLVAVGGGGLIAGISGWIRDDAEVVAVEPETCRSFNAAREAGTPTRVVNSGVASSSLATEVIGKFAWGARDWIDNSVLVTDHQIIEAQAWLWSTARLAVEPAAATPVAALMAGAYTPDPGQHVVAMISGANFDPGSVV